LVTNSPRVEITVVNNGSKSSILIRSVGVQFFRSKEERSRLERPQMLNSSGEKILIDEFFKSKFFQ